MSELLGAAAKRWDCGWADFRGTYGGPFTEAEKKHWEATAPLRRIEREKQDEERARNWGFDPTYVTVYESVTQEQEDAKNRLDCKNALGGISSLYLLEGGAVSIIVPSPGDEAILSKEVIEHLYHLVQST